MLQTLVEGMGIGLAIAAPVGPIGLMCIQRTLANGRASGWVSGLGAATADAFYATVAGFGVTSVSALLVSAQGWVRLLGGLFLLYLGARTFLSVPDESAPTPRTNRLLRDYSSTLGLTLSNPLTIISFAAVFTGLGLAAGASDYATAGALVAGVFGGSLLWWTVLCVTVGAIKHRIRPRQVRWINRISGAIIAVLGIAAIATLLV